MSAAGDKSERDRAQERIGDWEQFHPTVETPPFWDWRTVDLKDLDPGTSRMVARYRRRASELGIPLADAPEDPYELFDPPFPPAED